jgi:hypothetical protein
VIRLFLDAGHFLMPLMHHLVQQHILNKACAPFGVLVPTLDVRMATAEQTGPDAYLAARAKATDGRARAVLLRRAWFSQKDVRPREPAAKVGGVCSIPHVDQAGEVRPVPRADVGIVQDKRPQVAAVLKMTGRQCPG